MKQPIYVLTRKQFDYIFNWYRTSAKLPLSNLSLGTFTTLEELNESLDSLKFDSNDEILVSKVMEMLNDHYTSKMVAHANSSLDYIKTQIYYKRTIRSIAANIKTTNCK